MVCTYPFRHHLRPRDACDLPATEDEARASSLCRWHDADQRPPSFKVGEELVKEVSRSNHWIEGAVLSGADLTGLKLVRAKLPYSELEQASLSHTVLSWACLDISNMHSANLSRAVLNNASLVGSALDLADAQGANFEGADLSGASLEETRLDGAYLFGVKLDLRTEASDADWGLPGEFKECRYKRAANIFRALSTHFRSVSNHEEAEKFYYLEMTALHLEAIHATTIPTGGLCQKLKCWRSGVTERRVILKWLGWALHRWVWGYGVRPYRTFVWMIFIILLFGGILFPLVGICDPDGCAKYHPWQGLALSVVTFATLGYGNRTPFGPLGEFLGGIEATLGALLIGVFVVSLATKYVHRV